jgi:hypothetical protein
MDLHSDLLSVKIAKEGTIQESDFWLSPYVSPDDLKNEFDTWMSKNIPSEMSSISIRNNYCVFDVFAVNVTKYKEQEAKRTFDDRKAKGLIPIDQEYTPLLFTTDASGNVNVEWLYLPIARVLKCGQLDDSMNGLGITQGDIVRLTDSTAWKAENPVYKHFISEHPYPNAVGLTQVTPTPQRFVYNLIEGSGGIGKDAFNANPLTAKFYGFIFMRPVTDFVGKINDVSILFNEAQKPVINK